MEVAVEEAMTARADRIVPVAVHYADVMKTDAGTALVKRFGVKAYPSVVVDLDPASLLSVTSSELILSHVDRLLEARPESAGLKLESGLSEGKLQATVTATTVRDGSYTLHLILLEDGLVAAQTGGEKDHVHNNILRAWLDSDAFPACKAGQELTASFEVAAKEGWRPVALVCRDGLVDNVLPGAVGAVAESSYESNE